VVLVPRQDPWASMFAATKMFSDDYMTKREQGFQSERESFG
jgi:virulence-associated protein VagC